MRCTWNGKAWDGILDGTGEIQPFSVMPVYGMSKVSFQFYASIISINRNIS